MGKARSGFRVPGDFGRTKLKTKGLVRGLAESFRNAWSGLVHVYVTQRNMRIHLLFAALVGLACIVLQVGRLEVLMVSLAVAGVLVAEVTNTLAESMADLIEPRFNVLVKTIKDVAAAGVLLTAGFSVIVGGVVFFPLVSEIPARLQDFLQEPPRYFWGYVVVVIVPAVFGLLKGEG